MQLSDMTMLWTRDETPETYSLIVGKLRLWCQAHVRNTSPRPDVCVRTVRRVGGKVAGRDGRICTGHIFMDYTLSVEHDDYAIDSAPVHSTGRSDAFTH